MLWSAAGHTVKYAVERFEIDDLVDTDGWEGCRKGTNCPGYFDEMYNFLKWKFGTPALGAGQWLSAGYEHFDNAYSDEAAAILLGVIEFRNVTPELVMPVWMQEFMQTQGVEMTAAGITSFLATLGVPSAVAAPLAAKLAEYFVSRVPVAVFMPKAYDVDNALIEAAITAKRQWRDHRATSGPRSDGLWVPDLRLASVHSGPRWRAGEDIGGEDDLRTGRDRRVNGDRRSAGDRRNPVSGRELSPVE